MAMPCLYCLPDCLHGVQANAVMQASATFHGIMQPASLCPRQPAARQSVVASQQYYQTALQRVAKVCKLSVSPDHRRRRELMLQSLSAFLQTELAGLGLDLQNCGPLEVLIFMSEHYVPQHSGSRLPNGSVQMAPNSVANSLSALSMGFQDMGRQGPWNNGAGNPVQCHDVKSWQRGYTRESTAGGYKSRGAQVNPPCHCKIIACVHQYSACLSH